LAIYAIGDLQGCYDPLRRLLDRLGFDPRVDQLWFTGDLVNRGPQSLEALRFVHQLGDAARTVLGNHDLHLLAVYYGAGRLKRDDTIAPILAAEDGPELLEWLCHQPLLHEDSRLPGYTLIHAGLAPQWNLATARACAGEVETCLRTGDRQGYFDHLYGDEPAAWDASLRGWERLRFITNTFTRLRFCHDDGRLALAHKGPPQDAPPGVLPWFQVPGRPSFGRRIVFGHWSLLGWHDGNGVLALDTGCLWSGALTAARLDDGTHTATSVACG
jgi:bis(5'-nucleosyl)-tetraphosphatase (symmetrical)